MSGKHDKANGAFTLYLPKVKLTILKNWSKISGIPVSWIIRRAVDETLETHKKEVTPVHRL